MNKIAQNQGWRDGSAVQSAYHMYAICTYTYICGIIICTHTCVHILIRMHTTYTYTHIHIIDVHVYIQTYMHILIYIQYAHIHT